MKKFSEEKWITTVIILCILIFGVIAIINKMAPKSDADTAKCIGKNSILYTRLGCYFCEVQEDMFGDNYPYLTLIDCFFDEEKCSGISGTPTWVINGEKYVGVQSINKLKELTGC
jgi:preprotein translocase subunit Sec61beta